MNQPQVTVVVPLYNKARSIERSLRSLLAQSFEDFSIVVIDDGSTDDGNKIAMGIGDRRLRVMSQPNRGVSNARNRGVEVAEAERIVFLDADDELEKDFLGTILELSDRFPQAGLWGLSYCCWKGGRCVGPDLSRVEVAPTGGILDNYFGIVAREVIFATGSVMTTRSVVEKVGGFSKDSLAEDLDMWARIALAYPIAFRPTCGLRVYKEGMGHLSQSSRFSGEETSLMRTLQTALEEGGLQHRRSVEVYLGKHLLKIARHCIKAKRGGRARELCEEAWRLRAFRGTAARLWLRSIWRPWLPPSAH